MAACHAIQGKLNDLGVLCGSALSIPVEQASKGKLWNIYRYLNVVHISCFTSLSPTLKELSIEMDYITRLELLKMEVAMNIGLTES